MSEKPETFHNKLQEWLGPHPGTILFTAIFFLVFAAIIWHLCGVIAAANGDPASSSTNRLIAIFGGLIGWALGMAFAPYSKDDEARFEAIGKVAVAFFSGYLLSKFEIFVKEAFFPFKLNTYAWIQLCIFSVSMFLGALVVLTNRLYAFRREPENDDSKTKKDA